MLGLLVALVAIGAFTAEDEVERPGPKLPPLRPIVERVERIRGLGFRESPPARVVTPQETRREGLAELDRRYPAADRRADEEVLKLLGLLESTDDLRDVVSTIFSEEVAGYYDPQANRLSVVAGPSEGDAELDEITLAHELTHALEDQRFGLDADDEARGVDDRAAAELALNEGTATVAMIDYARRHLGVAGSREELLDALSAAAGAFATGDLPPYIEASLAFPYSAGARFADELFRLARGWKLLDAAYRTRLPSSTEQILHPVKYLQDERADPVRVHAAAALGRLGGRWRRAVAGQLGEFDTEQILRSGDPVRARRAAAGWGGGRFELWQRVGVAHRCGAPCRSRDVLVLAWSSDTGLDARELAGAIPGWLERGLDARPTGEGRWSVGRGAVALAADGRATTVVFAPRGADADGLAEAVLRGLGRARP